MEKRKEIKLAKKRRANLLKEFNRLGWTIAKLANKHNVSSQRMGWMLAKAREESNHTEEK